MALKVMAFALVFCVSVSAALAANPVVHQFKLWAIGTQNDKLLLYWGWTNGFFQGRGQRGVALETCLEGIAGDQVVAMIDKQYKDHPEKWSDPFGTQVIEALTIAGGPCEGKNPFAPDAK